MLADYFTKPLQGSLFRKFRAVILGHAHIHSLCVPIADASPEENVEVQNRNPKQTVTPTVITAPRTPPVTSAPVTWASVVEATQSKGYGYRTESLQPPHSLEEYPEVLTS
jgi:hypothetical protein